MKEIMPTGKFTKAQLDLLKMFATHIAEKDWEVIRNFAKQYFAERATEEMDELFSEKGWGKEKINEWIDEHMRTQYRQ